MDAPPHPIDELIRTNERTYQSHGQSIDYLLLKGTAFKDCLVVVFSAFNEASASIAKTYNYIRTLLDFDGNKLFIKDQCGPQGAYYLGQAPEYDFAKTTNELIEKVRQELGVPRRNVICIGSSKGGTCALYHGINGGYGGVIAGAPQTKIASYVQKCSLPTYEYMFGNSKENAEKADRILFETCNREIGTKIWIITTPLDWQYQEHVLPFLEEVGKNLQDLTVIVETIMKSHGDIATYLVKNLNHILTNFLIDLSKQEWQINLLKHLHSYNIAEKEFFDEADSIIRLPASRPLYIQTFDGIFDSPPKEAENVLLAGIPTGASDAVLVLEFEARANVIFNCFFMQYSSTGACIKTNKTWKCEGGDNVIHYPVPIGPNAALFKTALRFSSHSDNLIKIRMFGLSFITRDPVVQP